MLADYSSLEMTVLTYVYQCIAQGKTHELEELGVGVEDMKIIRKLPIMDIAKACKRPGVIKLVQLDRDVLAAMLKQANHSVEEDRTIDKLVEAGAHWRLVHHFFGTTKDELSTRRKLLNVTLRGRRRNGPPLNRKDTLVVLSLVQRHIEVYSQANRACAVYQCKAMLATAELTELPISSIWEAVDAAERRSEFDWFLAGKERQIA